MLLVLTCQSLHLIFQDCLVPKVGFYEILMSLMFDSLKSSEIKILNLSTFVRFIPKRYKEFPKLGTWVRRMRVRKIFHHSSEF